MSKLVRPFVKFGCPSMFVTEQALCLVNYSLWKSSHLSLNRMQYWLKHLIQINQFCHFPKMKLEVVKYLKLAQAVFALISAFLYVAKYRLIKIRTQPNI